MINKLYKMKINKKMKEYTETWVEDILKIDNLQNFYKLIYEEIKEMENEKN